MVMVASGELLDATAAPPPDVPVTVTTPPVPVLMVIGGVAVTGSWTG
jgi:hypothetical protein